MLHTIDMTERSIANALNVTRSEPVSVDAMFSNNINRSFNGLAAISGMDKNSSWLISPSKSVS